LDPSRRLFLLKPKGDSMAEYHLLRCLVALGGDDSTTVYRDRSRPILFPELVVLQYLHGEDAVTDVHIVGTCEMAIDEVMTRLVTLYGEDTVKVVFPGARPRIPRADSTIPFCTMPIYTPKPTRPDSPDPRLRPLDQFTMTQHMPRQVAPELPAENEPTDEEIAAHAQDDADNNEETMDQAAIDALADELGLGVPVKPSGAALTQGRKNYVGLGAAQRAANLPDVGSSTARRRDRVDRAPNG
jgi:hypothetical protein